MFVSKFSVIRHSFKPSVSLRTLVYCPDIPKKPIRRILTIIGGNTGEGQLAALLLKQSNILDEMRLYSGIIDPCGIAMDLSHIDTHTHVKSYFGQALLKAAITDADIILICGGQPNRPCRTSEEIFEDNADYVRNAALNVGEFNPKALLCISTPPINAMVPMVAEVLKKTNGYDPRKVFGIMNVATSKSNSLLGRYVDKDPASLWVPVVGGLGRYTTVSAFSQVKPCTPVPRPLACLLQDKISSSEDMILDLKNIENTGSCFVIGAYGCAKFITSLVKALKGQKTVTECAYIRQTGHIEAFLSYMASIVKLGPEGVHKIHMPKLNDLECQYLLNAYPHIQRHIEMGQCYVNGAIPKECRMHPRLSSACEIVFKKPEGIMIGDVVLDLKALSKEPKKCIEIIK